MKDLKVKVCGLNDKANIRKVIAAGVDLIGLIFYSKSPRSVDKGDIDAEFARSLDVKKVGVFVNEKEERVLSIAVKYQLDNLQLHGDESPEYCQKMRESGYQVWKAFSVKDHLDLVRLKNYETSVDWFLFDTKGKERGGTGVKFGWEALKEYNLDKPFLLSGGINVNDADAVKGLDIEQLWAVDVNSGFEASPGLKKINEVEHFIKRVK
ncbi:MAG: phosphoribosylanthranilate isomerase [Cyclobacteriaceae bacterium]